MSGVLKQLLIYQGVDFLFVLARPSFSADLRTPIVHGLDQDGILKRSTCRGSVSRG